MIKKLKGSAAFNLLVITSLSIYIAPSSSSNIRIKNNKLFLFSFVFSFFSLVWLYIMFKVTTPNQIDIWEASLTIFFYFLMLTIALSIDKCFGVAETADEQRFQKNVDSLNKLMKVISLTKLIILK